jgi:hypothetical protein
MKRMLVAWVTLVSAILFAVNVYADDKVTLGKNNFAVKAGFINFDDKNHDDSYYISAEGYKELGRNVYLGAEVGYVNTDGNVEIFGTDLDSDMIFIPIELNVKYVIRAVSHFVVDIGTGLSYSYAKEDVAETFTSERIDDWVWGAQFSADLHYTIDQFFLGISGKYQLTDKGKESANSYSNWRIGGHIGVTF